MTRVTRLYGQTFGQLTVWRRAKSTKGSGNARWQCRCSCGVTTIVIGSELLSGRVQSCGHLRATVTGTLKRTHGGRLNRLSSPEYSAWLELKRRCYNPASIGFKNYGGRGIQVCQRWLKGDGGQHPFLCFLEDVGRRPSTDYSIDRIDNNGDYKPGNVRWATRQQQALNRRPKSK